jgi:crotonobetainyl-CoA:carnitine CoA-transferase CaiB-like acyl-CoA transferase
MGLDDVAEDPRFTSIESMAEHSETAQRIVEGAIGDLTFTECQTLLRKGRGQWAPVQDAWEIANDEALTANGRIADIVDAEGHAQRLVANPVKFDNAPAILTRAPQFAEHTDGVLRELGIDDDRLIELKIAGAIT